MNAIEESVKLLNTKILQEKNSLEYQMQCK
jgi:hypothetical protein